MPRPDGPARIDAHGWGWRHHGRTPWAVSDLDLAIEPGERVLLLGASGAGKSTLVHALAGVLGGADDGEERGRLLVDGMSPADARGRVGLVLQDPDSQVILARVGDDVAFGCENLGIARDEIWQRVRHALHAVGLQLPLEHPTSSLSGGQKQRLALAGVLAMRPGLLLLDEPTANLDPDGVVEVRDAVARVVADRSTTLVVIEHRVEVWWEFVDRVIVLAADGSNGTGVLADGSPRNVLHRHGEELTASGIWIPGHRASPPARRRSIGGELVRADQVAIGRDTTVYADLSAVVHAGEIVAVSGPNGVGKSTLAQTIAGLLPERGGAVDASGIADGLGSRPIRWRSRELLTRVGTVFQDPEHQFLTGTVRDELGVGARALRLPEREAAARVDHLLQRLHLSHLVDVNPFTLSGGEKRRLSVATVLVTSPRLLVLDEPTFGQDARTWREMVALLADLVDDGCGALIVTHDSELIRCLADSELRMPPRELAVETT